MQKELFSAGLVTVAVLALACSNGDPLGPNDAAVDSPQPGADATIDSGPALDIFTRDGAAGTTGFSQQTLMVAGAQRTLSFYASANRGGQPPLVLAFHGTGGASNDWIDGNDPSGLESLADAHGFVVVAPQSRFLASPDWDHEYEGGDLFWETAVPNGQAPNTNPDLMLVNAIVNLAQSNFNIDAKRVYSLGFSNGGFFSVLTAVVLRDTIAAFAAVGSGLVACETTRSCTAQSTSTDCATILSSAGCTCVGSEKPTTIPVGAPRMPPAFLAHNNRDDIVSVYYTCALNKRLTELGYPVTVTIGNEEGHGFPEGSLEQIWAHFSKHTLP